MNTLVVTIAGRQPHELLEQSEVAAILNTTIKTLGVWRAQKRGPAPTKADGDWRVQYTVASICSYLAVEKPWSSVKRQQPRAA